MIFFKDWQECVKNWLKIVRKLDKLYLDLFSVSIYHINNDQPIMVPFLAIASIVW